MRDAVTKPARLHFVQKTVLRFTPESHIAFGQGEIQSKLVQNSRIRLKTAEFDCCGPVLIEFLQEIAPPSYHPPPLIIAIHHLFWVYSILFRLFFFGRQKYYLSNIVFFFMPA
jgi:hypothetical protein